MLSFFLSESQNGLCLSSQTPAKIFCLLQAITWLTKTMLRSVRRVALQWIPAQMWSKYYYPSWENSCRSGAGGRAGLSQHSGEGTGVCWQLSWWLFSFLTLLGLTRKPGKWSNTTHRRYTPRGPAWANIPASCSQHTSPSKASWLQLKRLSNLALEGLTLDWAQVSVRGAP